MDKARLLYLQNRVAYARDQAAYKELYLYFHPSVYKLAYTIIPRETVAEDIVAEVMTRLWTMETNLAYVDHLKPYLLTATRNTALTWLKKNPAEAPIEITEQEHIPTVTEGPEQQFITLELSRLIEHTVQALPQKCQLVFRLIKEEGLSYKEAGQILGISQNTLETHMCVALKKLRIALDGYLLKR